MGRSTDKRALLNLTLVVAVAVLTTVVVLEPGKQAPPAGPALTPWTAAEVNTLRIERGDAPPVVLERQAEGWRMSAPRSLPAHAIRAGMVSRAAEIASLSRIGTPGDLAQYRLAPPLATLTLNDHTLAFGDIDPLQQRRYLLVDGALHLTADTLFPLINRGWSHFVDPALLPPRTRIEAIHLTDGTRLTRDDTGWSVTPQREGGSADAPVRLVDAWRHTQALAVSPLGDEMKSDEAVTLTLEGGDTIRFEILRRQPELLLARPDLGLRYQLADGGDALLALGNAQLKGAAESSD